MGISWNNETSFFSVARVVGLEDDEIGVYYWLLGWLKHSNEQNPERNEHISGELLIF